MNLAVGDLQTLLEVGAVAGLADGDLLDRFVARGDEAALETLIKRHAAMVWGVCRRTLGDRHDAEDAFQATFLVLARRAGSVRPASLVGHWLHGVAVRTALKARATRARRRVREVPAASIAEPAAAVEGDIPHDLLARLDQEVRGLPRKYQEPIVLCDLQEKTHREAADVLGWPVGTVSGRLSRGRVLLARRLTRQGGPEVGGSLAVGLLQTPLAPAPIRLVDATARAAVLFASGRLDALAPPVLILTQGVIRTMKLSQIKIVVAALLAVGAVGTGGGLLYQADRSAQAAGPKANEPSSDLQRLQGVWTGVVAEIGGRTENNVFPDAQVRVKGDELNLRGLFYGELVAYSKDIDKKFVLKLDESRPLKTIDLTIPPAFDDVSPTRYEGVYQLDGDALQLCLSIPNKKRPTRLATEFRTNQSLLKLKRDPSGEWSQRLAPPNLTAKEPAPAEAKAVKAIPTPHSPPTKVDADLVRAVPGRIALAASVTKDSMVLAYIPDWAFGNVDNIGLGNNDGGVRVLVDWPEVTLDDAKSPDRRFYLACYARKFNAGQTKPSPIQAFEIESAWPERTSWASQPNYAKEPSASYAFEPGVGWKLFDITPVIEARLKTNRLGQGIVLRFADETVPAGPEKAWTDFNFVSREGQVEWATRGPKLLVVDPPQPK